MIGTLLRARYELLQEIGESPVFRSFVAHDRVTERNVVIRQVKDPYNAEKPFVTKLRQAFEKSKKTDHPAVSRALDMDEDGGRWFLVYQYSPGKSLSERIKRASAMGVSTALTTLTGILEGLDAVHRQGLVHGEIGVRNVVVSNAGNPSLLNACIWEAYSSSESAGAEMLPLLAPYLAPEVTMGDMPSSCSDVYAAGVLFYELLTGEKPYKGKNPVDVAGAHASGPLPTIKDKVSAVPDAMEKILQKALAKEPTDRYKDAGAMLSDLRMLQDAMKFGRPLTWPLRPVATAAPTRVGPKLNAAHVEQKEQKVAKKRARDDSDGAPAWLAYTGMVFLGGAVLAIGWWAFFNLSAPATLKVPNIVGLSFNEAASQLDRMHLTLRKVREAPSEQYAEGVVLSVQPNVGRDVKEHSFVDAVVSSGSKFVEVPDLTGKTVEEAKRLLASMGLSVASNVRYVRSETAPEGQIVGQRPSKHSQVERKSAVELYVSEGAPPIEDLAPPDTKYVYHLSWTLPDMAHDILVRVEMTDNAGTRTIFEDSRGPNAQIEIDAEGTGKQATFHIFYDNELVQTITKNADDEQQQNTTGDGGGAAGGGATTTTGGDQ